MKTLIKTMFSFNVVFFKENLEYFQSHSFITMNKFQDCKLSTMFWLSLTIMKVVIETLGLIVRQCILNQTRNYKLLLNVLYFTFYRIWVKLQKKHKVLATYDLGLFNLGIWTWGLEILSVGMGTETIDVQYTFFYHLPRMWPYTSTQYVCHLIGS